MLTSSVQPQSYSRSKNGSYMFLLQQVRNYKADEVQQRNVGEFFQRNLTQSKNSQNLHLVQKYHCHTPQVHHLIPNSDGCYRHENL